MCGIREVDFCGAKFACLDDLPVGAKVDVIVRPEDVIMTAPEDGTITGVVQSVIFKGMHYEIIVESGDNEVVIQSTRSAKEGDTIGMCLEPDGIPCNSGRYQPEYFRGRADEIIIRWNLQAASMPVM